MCKKKQTFNEGCEDESTRLQLVCSSMTRFRFVLPSSQTSSKVSSFALVSQSTIFTLEDKYKGRFCRITYRQFKVKKLNVDQYFYILIINEKVLVLCEK